MTTKIQMKTLESELAGRMRAINRAWVLRREGAELVLYGNGEIAAWRTDASCIDWLKHMEADVRRRLPARKRRRTRTTIATATTAPDPPPSQPDDDDDGERGLFG